VVPANGGNADPRCRLERDGGSLALAQPRGNNVTALATSSERR
jgi:hypothetical protein